MIRSWTNSERRSTRWNREMAYGGVDVNITEFLNLMEPRMDT